MDISMAFSKKKTPKIEGYGFPYGKKPTDFTT
jgi:hypothetical protein